MFGKGLPSKRVTKKTTQMHVHNSSSRHGSHRDRRVCVYNSERGKEGELKQAVTRLDLRGNLARKEPSNVEGAIAEMGQGAIVGPPDRPQKTARSDPPRRSLGRIPERKIQ